MDKIEIDNLKNTIRKTLGLKETERLFLDRPFEKYNPNVDKSNLLEILQSIGLDTIISLYITENRLNNEGRELLRKVGFYAANESPNVLDLNPNLYILAEQKNLDEIIRKANVLDFVYLREYFDKIN